MARIMEGIARLDATKAQAMDVVTCHYLSPGKVKDKAASLGLRAGDV